MHLPLVQGWGVAVLVGVPHKDAVFKTHPVNFLNERTLKGTFFGNYKPRTDLPSVVEMYMKKVTRTDHLPIIFDSILSAFKFQEDHNQCHCTYLIGSSQYHVLQELQLEKFITHSTTLSEINKAFDLMLRGESLRCIIRMDG